MPGRSGAGTTKPSPAAVTTAVAPQATTRQSEAVVLEPGAMSARGEHMQFDALPREAWIVLALAIVLVGAVVLYAIANGRSVSLGLKKGTSRFNLGVGKKPDANTTPASSGS